jgi:hypothetical protein
MECWLVVRTLVLARQEMKVYRMRAMQAFEQALGNLDSVPRVDSGCRNRTAVGRRTLACGGDKDQQS